MSYGFEMYFKQVKSKEEAFDFAMSIMKNIFENAEERIKNARFYIPSYPEMKENRTTDEYWLYSVFTESFTYWEKENLLGMFGVTLPKSTIKMFDASVYFQDSTDQDYDLETWDDNILYFKKIIDTVSGMSKDDLLNVIMERWGYDKENEVELLEMKENIEKDPEYYRNSAIYSIIFDELDLELWMDDENESDKFIRFNLCAINGADSYFRLRTILNAVKSELKKEME